MVNRRIFLLCAIFLTGYCTTIISQDKRPPMMGWSSWNTFRVHINEKLINETADAMVSQGLKNAGYNYLNIDDGYFGGRNGQGILYTNKQKFPNGMKPIADYIHSKGLKAGVYSDAGSNTCGSIYDADTLGVGVGLWQHDKIDCQTFFKDWGFDYIKVDWCGGESTGQSEEQRYTDIYKAIQQTGRTDIRFNICRWQFPGTWATKIADSWRIHTDINPRFKTIDRIIEENLYLAAYTSPGHYNDMDMLEVGRGLSKDEEQTHFGIWCIMSSPLMIGCDLRTIPQQTLELITNHEAIALNQDSLGLQAEVIRRGKDYVILAKPVGQRTGKTFAVALYNRGDFPKKIRIDFKELNLDTKVHIRNLWEHQNLGIFTEYYETLVPSHGTALLKLEGTKRYDKTCYEAEYAYMNEYTPEKKKTSAYFAPMTGASGGYLMKNLGNNPTNWAEFRNVYISKSGKYNLKLTYFSKEKRNLYLMVNDETYLLSGLNSGNWNEPGTSTTQIKLRKGNNIIRLYNPNEWAPDIDKIEITNSK